jgi:hypothetical protein
MAAVKAADLQTPEQAIDLTTRRRAPRLEDPEDTAAEQLAAMRARIETARTLDHDPNPNTAHCADCYQRGVKAAIAVIEGPKPETT